MSTFAPLSHSEAISTEVPVKVGVQSYEDLLINSSQYPLGVDTYQRGFVWSKDKIRQMMDDLMAYQALEGPKPPYYMGSVLLHRSDEKGMRFVIDGQQRLTALSVLYKILNGVLPVHFALTYSPKSERCISAAAQVFREAAGDLSGNIFESIAFTVIEVTSVDLAFTFFDTQNNRGVPLHATDLLKAYHLRAVNGDDTTHREALQSLCARRWEVIQQGAPVMSHEPEFVASLFSKFLWRSRYWKGSRVVYGGHDALMDEFQKRSWPAGSDKDTIPLYRSRHNRLGTALTLRPEGHGEIHTNRISLSSKPEDLPFAIRQPIHEGIGFFLYADKYAALLRRLVSDPTDSREIQLFRGVYEKLMMANSHFLREIFLLSALMYVDQFDDENLWAFSLWMDHALGAIRLDKQQVRYEAAQNFFKHDTLNLLDVIAHSYRPEEVLRHLSSFHGKQEIYNGEKIVTGKGVQGAYKKAVIDYYGRMPDESLGEKLNWLRAMLATKSQGGAA
jgi:hypothetical protein